MPLFWSNVYCILPTIFKPKPGPLTSATAPHGRSAGPSGPKPAATSSAKAGAANHSSSFDAIDPSSDANIFVDDEPRMNPAIEHCKEKYVLIQCLGAASNGVVYAAITKEYANYMLYQKRLGRAAQVEPKDIVAVKFSLGLNGAHGKAAADSDLSNEINFMDRGQGLLEGHDLLVHAIGAYRKGPIQWLALPYCNGGSLYDFALRHPDAVTKSFVWHVGLSILRAACYFHWGIRNLNDMDAVDDWPSLYHGDLYANNIFLKANDDPKYFPDCLIADFGRASVWDPRDPKNSSLAKERMFISRQLHDIKSIRRIMEFLRSIADQRKYCCNGRTECEDCLTRRAECDGDEVINLWIDSLKHVETHVDDLFTDILPFLKKFYLAGCYEQLKYMEEQPAAVSKFLSGRNIKGEYIAEALAKFEAREIDAEQCAQYLAEMKLYG